jgi:glycerophosphoryl diester phosphodiesterase
MRKLIIAHRGNQSVGLENTIPAISDAARVADAVEIDVHQCKTGEFIVHHDPTTWRMSNDHVAIANQTLKQLRSIPLHDGSRIATLQEVFSALPDDFLLNIEHKTGRLSELAQFVIKSNRHSSTIISGRNLTKLEVLKQVYPQLRIGLVRRWARLSPQRAKEIGLEFITSRRELAYLTPIERYRQAGIDIWIYGYRTLPADYRTSIFVDRLGLK